MCEINPKHKAFFKIEAFTTANINDSEFMELVCKELSMLELQLNSNSSIRYHIHEMDSTT
jgi:predicted nuclease of predicted toxin-antitoxin system